MAEKRNANFLNLFVQVTKKITSSLEPDDVFRLITKSIPQIIGVDAATIRLLDNSGKKLELRAAHGLSEAYLNRGTIDTEEPIFKALRGEPITIDNARQDPRIKFPDATKKEGIETILVVPIPIRGEIHGILRLLTRKPHTYHQDEINLVTAIGEQCGIAIENARIFRKQQIQLNYFKAIHEIGQKINSTYELDTILDLIVTRLPAVMDLKAATIRLFEGKKGKLELKAAYGLSQAYLERGPLDDELATHYVNKGEPVIILDAKQDLHTIYHEEAKAEGISSILAVPISVQGEIIGIMRLLTEEVRNFSAVDIKFAMAIAEQGGVAIQRALEYGKFSERSPG